MEPPEGWEPYGRPARRTQRLLSALGRRYGLERGVENEAVVLAAGLEQQLQEILQRLHCAGAGRIPGEELRTLCRVPGLREAAEPERCRGCGTGSGPSSPSATSTRGSAATSAAARGRGCRRAGRASAARARSARAAPAAAAPAPPSPSGGRRGPAAESAARRRRRWSGPRSAWPSCSRRRAACGSCWRTCGPPCGAAMRGARRCRCSWHLNTCSKYLEKNERFRCVIELMDIVAGAALFLMMFFAGICYCWKRKWSTSPHSRDRPNASAWMTWICQPASPFMCPFAMPQLQHQLLPVCMVSPGPRRGHSVGKGTGPIP